MNANQQVQYRKLMGYLSPYDSTKINSPEYQQLKRRTESQRSSIDTEGNEFILRQLGTPIMKKQRYSEGRILPTSLTRPSTRKQQNQVLHSGIKQNGRSNSVHAFNFNNQQINHVPSIQLQKLEHNKRMSHDMNTPSKRISQNNTPIHSSRNKNHQHQTPSNFSKQMFGANEGESFSIVENNNSQLKGQPAMFGNQSQIKSSLNIASIIENVNLSKSQHQHHTISKSVVYQEPVKYAWSEIKFKGKLCEGRSFSQAVIFNNQFYFYGGYDSNKGVFRDFVYLTFSQSGPSQFRNEELSPENKETPGRLCRHGAILRNSSMIIFGGKTSSIQSTNGMFEYNFDERQFHRITPLLQNVDELSQKLRHSIHHKKHEGKYHLMPSIDSHSMIYDSKRDQLIISGGFYGDLCEYSMDIYTFSFSDNSWTFIPSKSEISQMPTPRAAHGSVLQINKLYIFGGTDGENILEDMWYFDMDTQLWTKIDFSNQKIQPGPRSGIQMMEFEGYFVVFGGFKSLINERNDLTLFDSRKQEWVYQSERKEIVEMIQTQSIPPSPARMKQHTSAKGGISISKQILSQHRYESPMKTDDSRSNIYQYGSQSQITSPNSKKHFMPIQQKDEINELILKNRDSKQKVNFEKKMQLLKQFEVPEELKNKLLSPTPILQSMKSSLHLLSTCNKSHKYDHINETQLKSQNFQNTESQIKGKHPGARDGYLSAIIGEKLIIFGGDRHRMSLNDTYELDLRMIIDYTKRL